MSLNILEQLKNKPKPAFCWGMLWGCVWLFLEASAVVLRRKLQHDQADAQGSVAWEALVYFCLGATFPLALGAMTTWLAHLWHSTWRLTGNAPLTLHDALWKRGSGATRISAGLLTLTFLSCSASLLGMPIVLNILAAVRTPLYAGVAAWLVSVCSFICVCSLAPIVWGKLEQFLGSSAAEENSRLFLPGSLILLALVFVQLATCALILGSRAWADAIAWVFVFAPAFSLTLMISAGVPLNKKIPRIAQQGAVVLLLALGALAALAPLPLLRSVRSALSEPGMASSWAKLTSTLADVDGDEASGLYGVPECAPFNSAVYPGAAEIPNNGIDEDCDGHDLDEAPGSSLEVEFNESQRPSRLSARPHILLITTDSLSASHTGIGASKTDTTPELDAWAKRATVFQAAFSNGNATHSAIPTLLTGAYPSAIPTLQKGTTHAPFFTDQAVLLPALLRAQGYDTVAILGDRYFSQHAWPSLADSFDVFSLSEYEQAKKLEPQGGVHAAPLLTKRAIQEIKKQRKRPLFLWVHYFDHHNPHTPRDEWISDINPAQTASDRFDQELHYADQHWGELFRAIESSYKAEDYIAIFTADHGEAFDKNHPLANHQVSLHGEELHVPLVIQTYAERGRSYSELTSHLDVVPTLGALVGFRSSLVGEGESLVGALFEGKPPQKAVIYSIFYEAHLLRENRDAFRQIGIRTDQHYLVSNLENREQYLAEWRTDPLEENDLRHEAPQLATQLSYYLNRKLTQLRDGQQTAVDGRRP